MAEWYENSPSNSEKLGQERTETSGTTTGTPIHLSKAYDQVVVWVNPVGVATVEYTYDSNAKVVAGTAAWKVWEAGAVSDAADSLFLMAPTAVRLVSVSGGDATLRVVSAGK